MKYWLDQNHVLVTLVHVKGSAPQEVGSKMLVNTEGLVSGTVGGGKIENHCIEFAKQLLKDKANPQMQTWNLQKDIGMSCGGEVSVFFDVNLFSNWTVAIFGAGHVSQELTRVMSTWSCDLRVFDTREEWVNRLSQSPNITAKVSTNLAAEVEGLPNDTFLISMTQGHATDVPVLRETLKRHDQFGFVGVIGSDVKGMKIRKELLELGIPSEAIEKLRCPVGLPIGNNTPPEIAISIAAQLLEFKDNKEKK